MYSPSFTPEITNLPFRLMGASVPPAPRSGMIFNQRLRRSPIGAIEPLRLSTNAFSTHGKLESNIQLRLFKANVAFLKLKTGSGHLNRVQTPWNVLNLSIRCPVQYPLRGCVHQFRINLGNSSTCHVETRDVNRPFWKVADFNALGTTYRDTQHRRENSRSHDLILGSGRSARKRAERPRNRTDSETDTSSAPSTAAPRQNSGRQIIESCRKTTLWLGKRRLRKRPPLRLLAQAKSAKRT